MLAFLVNTAIATGVLYNIHNSMKIKDRAARKFYKHYFIVIAMLLSLDSSLSFLLHRIPYFQLFKLFILLWLSIPNGTGPHFIYNVYIRNIHKLFEGDIDSVINNFKGYYQDLKNKYHDVIEKNKKGEIKIGFHNSSDLEKSDKKMETAEVESSEAEPSSAVSDHMVDEIKDE